MPTRGFISVSDHENEKSQVLVWVQDVGAGNYGSVTQDLDELKDAIDTISIGTVGQAGFTKTFPEAGGYPSTNSAAQRETKWLVTYQDAVPYLDALGTIANPGYLKIFTADIPCADLSLLPDGKSELDLADGGVVEAFVDAWEANARTPYNHTSAYVQAVRVTVLSIKHVGRNV